MNDNDTDTNGMYETERFCRWDDLFGYYRKQSVGWAGWIFRGQSQCRWELKPSLERVVVDRFGREYEAMKGIEAGLLRRFKRQLHHFATPTPPDDARMEWLALMQHHEAPTRLLDWTYSFFVAVYFAVESTAVGDSCAVWAFDTDWWRGKAKEQLPERVQGRIVCDPNAKNPTTITAIFREKTALVYPVNPYRLIERLALQQGVFLAPGDITKSFIDNMRAIYSPDDDDYHLVKLEIACDKSFLAEAIVELHRMNVNRATLFPGLDGFTKHLENLIVVPRALAIDESGIFDE